MVRLLGISQRGGGGGAAGERDNEDSANNGGGSSVGGGSSMLSTMPSSLGGGGSQSALKASSSSATRQPLLGDDQLHDVVSAGGEDGPRAQVRALSTPMSGSATSLLRPHLPYNTFAGKRRHRLGEDR